MTISLSKPQSLTSLRIKDYTLEFQTRLLHCSSMSNNKCNLHFTVCIHWHNAFFSCGVRSLCLKLTRHTGSSRDIETTFWTQPAYF